MTISGTNEYLGPFRVFCAGFQPKISNLAISVGLRVYNIYNTNRKLDLAVQIRYQPTLYD